MGDISDMIYRGYEVHAENAGGSGDTAGGCKDRAVSRVIVQGVRDFDPVHIFECGQCFRWQGQPDGSYTGVVRGKVANVKYIPGTPGMTQSTMPDAMCTLDEADMPGITDTLGTSDIPSTLILENVTMEDFKQVWFDYFDLDTDYSHIKKAVSIDPIMKKAVEFGSGIRILRQKPWEVLISFIISANNRIPRIKKIIDDICRFFGEQTGYNGEKYYTFPDAPVLAACSMEQIQECRAGYRCAYIHETSKAVVAGGFDPQRLAVMKTDEAREALLKLMGVGNKVADCILLYSGIKRDVFPTDVWVKRVMEELYFGREAGFKEIQQFAAEKFGEYAGVAQQYLFYYAREQKIGG
jgi:N-glycosylase/DNA lyase